MHMTLWVGKLFSFVSRFDISTSSRGCGLCVWCLKFSAWILSYLSLSDPSIGWLSASSKLPVKMKKTLKNITHQILQMLSHRSWEQLQQPQRRSPLHATDPAFRAAGNLRKGFCIAKWDKSYKELRPRTQLDCKVSIWCVRLYLDRCQHLSLSFTAALLVCSVQQPSDVPCVWQPFPRALPDMCVAPQLEGSLLCPALHTDVMKMGCLKHISMAWPPFCFQEALAL